MQINAAWILRLKNDENEGSTRMADMKFKSIRLVGSASFLLM